MIDDPNASGDPQVGAPGLRGRAVTPLGRSYDRPRTDSAIAVALTKNASSSTGLNGIG